ncbi:hypothetical protein ACFVGM_28145 [Kitasatospora purpeofusca]|uniref:hypothetical protein n=1 Tax=Kitasatospora purpeofusca TaxID=67352 RepID=UPI0036AB6F93
MTFPTVRRAVLAGRAEQCAEVDERRRARAEAMNAPAVRRPGPRSSRRRPSAR